MAGWGNEVEKDVDAVVAEPWVTLDTRLLGKNIIVLSLEVSLNLGEAGLVVDLVSEAWGVDNGQRDAGSLLVQLEFFRKVSVCSKCAGHIGCAHRL